MLQRKLRRPRPVVLGGVMVAPALLLGSQLGAGECPVADPAPVVLEGDPAPGTDDAFQTFDRPNISENGHIAFAGDTDGATDADDVVYVDDMLIAREGDPAPGTKGGAYSSFEFFETAHQVNAAGDLAYIATLRDVPADQNRAVYLNDVLIAQEGDMPPGIADRLYVDFGFAGATDDGTVGFLADLDGATSDDSVIVLGDMILYRQGDAVPGLKGETWDGDFDEIQWNGAGDLLFEGNTSLAGDDMVVFRRMQLKGGGIVEEIVAQEGMKIMASGGEDFLELILQNALAENGMWGLRGNLGVAPTEEDAILFTESGFMAQQGDAVPELPDVELGNFNGININSLGDVLYLADLQGATPTGVDEGLFVNGCLLLTNGTQAPGLPDGTTFSDIGFEDMYINDDRMIVFAASYTGTVSGDGLFTIQLPVDEDCPEDLDGSGDVGFTDLLAVLAAWGPCPGCAEDLDSSGDVGFTDLLAVLVAWGPCP